ncbi:CLUMA_CG008996, isoform A [Clunio marinus]|uniref:Vacuolar protein sorting-associated protein 53 homolog n=1 Tax=Clunio marinus TaxID=568069 RepID=A0A1J1I5B3_9DIPT|nr:CLUMA_CG008996, isoform A [Clunio marinus]
MDEIKIELSDEVQKAIEQVLQSEDPLDKSDFNATEYINRLFPNEIALNGIDDIISQMEIEVQVIDDNIRSVVRGVSTSGTEGKQALDEAKKTITQLFSQIGDIKSRAEVTEEIVKNITSDIKQLDCAKKNLTSAITTLNHLHMLVDGVDKLKVLAEKRLYGEISNPLQAITEVNEHFTQYNEIPQIKELSSSVAEIHKTLSTQITEDFKNTFSLSPSANKMSLAKLKDACLVISVLDGKVRRELLKWFINIQLQEYIQLFHENQDISWLDKIDKRYAWIKRHLLDFEDKYGSVFPDNWEVSERIVVEFCNITRSELSKIMSRRRTEIDVKLLLYAINKTSQFEELLGKRFSGCTLNESVSNKQANVHEKRATLVDGDKNNQTENVENAEDEVVLSFMTTPFRNLIGECFKPYLDIYTDSIDRNLNDLIEKFVQVSKQQSVAASLESCAELFIFYKKSLVQCTQLSNGKTMFDLVLVYKKYLREYAIKILENQTPKVSITTTNATISNSMSLLKQKDFQNLQSAANQVIHSFLKEGEIPRYTKDERILICKILTTSEYCLETIQQLEEKLKEKIDPTFANNVDLSDEKDVFHRVMGHCIQLLVQDLENLCESALVVMSKIQWQNISNVGDQSPYINTIISHFKQTIPNIRDNLSSSRKYYTQFCNKFISSFIPKFINNLYKCRPTNAEGVGNIMGCEQLLLDTHSLKTVLLELPTIDSQVNRKAPASCAKTVIKGMTKAEMIIKIVMANINPHALFIEQYLKLLPDNTLAEFHKICDMKGVKRADQAQLIDLYKKMAPESQNEAEIDPTNETTDDKGRIKKLENLIKKRLPN